MKDAFAETHTVHINPTDIKSYTVRKQKVQSTRQEKHTLSGIAAYFSLAENPIDIAYGNSHPVSSSFVRLNALPRFPFKRNMY